MNSHIISFVLLLIMPFGFMAQNNINSNNKPKEIHLLFKPGKAKVTNKHKKILDKAESELKEGKEVWIYPLSTYSKKKTKSAVSNQRQMGRNANICFDPKSEEQANAIVDYLLTTNNSKIVIDKDFKCLLKGPSIRLKLSINYYQEPIAFNGKKEKPRISSEQMSLKDLYPEKKSQYFTINPKEDTLIVGEEGTKLFFAKGSMISDELVQIELKEFYKTSDFFKADLQTVSNGKLLYTGGTIYLDARKKSDLKTQVKINPSRGINAEFTEGNKDPEMELFLKDKNSRETNWVRDRKRRWRYTRNYMLNKEEIYKTLEFNSPNEYQVFFTSGKAKSVEDEWMTLLREIYMEKRNAEIAKRNAELAKIRAKQDSIYEIENVKRREEYERIAKNDATISRLAINNLGFINCDKFVDTITEQFEIFADESVKATYYAVFEGYNKGILKGRGSKTIRFGKLPTNEALTIIAISITEGSKHIFKKRINSTKEDIGEVVLAKATKAELDNLLVGLNE